METELPMHCGLNTENSTVSFSRDMMVGKAQTEKDGSST